MTELDKLEQYLRENKYDYERFDCDEPGNIRHQILVYGDAEVLWDAICDTGSLGYEEGLLEVMGEAVMLPGERGKIAGYLTADDVIYRLERRL